MVSFIPSFKDFKHLKPYESRRDISIILILSPIGIELSNIIETLVLVSSLYISTIEHKNRHDSVSVNEIYDFIQDLQDELDFKVPHVAKRDISLCFYILDKLGVCSCLK